MPPLSHRARLWPALTAFLLLVAFGCGKQNEIIVESAAGREATPETIDKDPLALLPPAGIGYLHVDMKQLMASAFGARLKELFTRRSPFPASSGFDVGRDLAAIYVASYSMQGMDVVGVAVGTFDPAKIERAAGSGEATPLGGPLTKSTYAGRALYTTGEVGFSILTSKTVLIGNETGIRRALDRIKEGRVARALEPWVAELLATPNVAFSGGADLRASPLPEAARRRLSFLQGIETVRSVGNFKPPGINLAGTASYATEQAAVDASLSLKRVYEIVAPFAWVMRTFLGTDQPLKRVDAVAQQRDMQFVIEFDGDAVGNLLSRLLEMVAPPSSTG